MRLGDVSWIGLGACLVFLARDWNILDRSLGERDYARLRASFGSAPPADIGKPGYTSICAS